MEETTWVVTEGADYETHDVKPSFRSKTGAEEYVEKRKAEHSKPENWKLMHSDADQVWHHNGSDNIVMHLTTLNN